MKGLLNFNGPHRSLTKLGPFDYRPGDVHHVFHGLNVHKSVFDESRYAFLNIPSADGGDFERWPQPVDQKTSRPPFIGSPEQFNHGFRERITPFRRGQRTVSPAHNPHPSVHLATPEGFTVPPH